MSYKIVLALVLGAVFSFVGLVALINEKENAQREANAKAAGAAKAKVAADEKAAFERLSPAEHLAEAKKLLTVDEKEAAISTGLKHIAAIRKNSAIYKQAEQTRRTFEQAKLKHDAEESKKEALAEAVTKVALRVSCAKLIENELLDQGMNVDVSATGKNQTVLRIKWILASKVLAHQLTKEQGFFASARKAGFKRVEITDGYDETWWWKLD